MKRILLFILTLSLLLLAGLWHWHSLERKHLEDQFIQNQIETVLKPKTQQIEKIFNSLYQNIRTITLLPSVRNIQGSNRLSDSENIVSSGRFTEEGWETVQQIYNNLASNVSVSEIYAVIEGLDYTKGQVPFFMFDTLVFGSQSVEAENENNPDFPEESEDEEYSYFPKQIAIIKSAHPDFSFSQMDEIPAYFSPLMRTCDNTQYLSKSQGNEHETFGMLYSVPFYHQKSGQFKGVISAIIRANVFEAALMNVPFVPVTPKDLAEQKAANWPLPEVSRFELSNKSYGIQILDRRNTSLENDLKAGAIGRNVFHVKLNVHSDAEWQLSYYLPEAMIQEALEESDRAFIILVLVLFGVLLLATLAVVMVARTRARLGGKPEVVADVVNAVSQGNLAVNIPSDVNSNSVLGSMVRMLQQLRVSAEQAQENQRIRQALDNVSTCVMIANDQRKVIYLNPAQQNLLQKNQNAFKDIITDFSVDKALGLKMEHFHPDPQHQAILIDSLKSTVEDNIIVGGCNFRLLANPIFDEAKHRLGTVVVWMDRTDEVAAEHIEQAIKEEVADIINAASSGDYRRRIKTESQEGFFKILADGMNRLLDSNAQALKEVGIVLGAMAQGDLTQRMTNDYQGALGKLKDDSNATVDHLIEVFTQLSKAANSIDKASREIAQGNSDLSQRTERQAASIEQTAASMEELSTTVQQNADNAKQANLMAVSASEIAAKGGKVVQDVVSTMSEITESSRKIFDTISIIDSIAFQTNILALNAAVEAARAREQGRGFAVVATEVRTLAQRCASAAKEIKIAIEASSKQVKIGTNLVSEAGQTMNEIVSSVNKVTQIMAEIAHASAEQSSGIALVKSAINEMDNMTQNNAALVEEASAASETLKDQAQSLSQSVSTFRF